MEPFTLSEPASLSDVSGKIHWSESEFMANGQCRPRQYRSFQGTYHLGLIDRVGRWKPEACSHCPRLDRMIRMGKVEEGLRRQHRCNLAGTVLKHLIQRDFRLHSTVYPDTGNMTRKQNCKPTHLIVSTCLVLARPSLSTPRPLITVRDEVARFRVQPRVSLTRCSNAKGCQISID